MHKCPSCGGDVPPDVERCKFCDARMPAVAGEEPAAGSPSPLEEQVLSLMRQGQKIEAIKVYRAATACGLKEAKDSVESLAAKHGIVARGAGCASAILLLLVVAALCLAAIS
jgi:ribosomal protein L7/L12